MSRTTKDSRSVKGTVLTIVKRQDNTFDLFLDGRLDQAETPEKYLPEWLCGRFGFCGEEFNSILHEVNLNGRAVVRF
jgi:hypothetical protein